jgi:structural maintenance of chromosome 2
MAYTVASQNNGFAKPAYELIDYPQDLRNSIMFGFGNFIICSTSAIANKIAFHPNKQLACRCVTFDGDIL